MRVQLIAIRSRCCPAFFSSIVYLLPDLLVNSFDVLLSCQIVVQDHLLDLPDAIPFVSLLRHFVSRAINESWIRHGMPVLPVSTALHLHRFLFFAHLSFDIPKNFSQQKCVCAVNPNAFQVGLPVVESVSGHGVAFSSGTHCLVVVL